MSEYRLRSRRARNTVVVGAAALSVLLTGCGGTRMSDEAIERAAGVRQSVPLTPTASDVTTGATTGVADPAPAAGAPAVSTGAATAGTGAAASAAPRSPKGNVNPIPTTTVGRPAAGTSTTTVGPANKSLIRVGAVGTFSGPVGALVKDTITGLRVWSQWINARGGVNGHPIEVLVGDDGGDPARFASIQQQFVEQKGAIAFLYATLGFAPNGNNKYLDAKKIFTFGTEGGLETAYTNPYVLTATPTGYSFADSVLLALGDAARPLGKKKFATFTCSDFALCDLFDQRWSDPEALKAVGFELVARGRPSLTQPDYTAQCLAAKNAGAEVIQFALDTASLRRFAGDCARQNYRPIFGTADLLALSSLPSDPNVDGMVVASKMAPWTATSVPGIAEATKAFAQYAPGTQFSGGNANGWILGEFFAAAGVNFPDGTVTEADVEAGIYRIRNNNLKGMTFPITMTRGQPMARQVCYGVAVIKNRAYSQAAGPALRCPKNPLPSNASAQAMSAPSAQASFASASLRPMIRASCPPARVTGFSYLLDAFQTGSSAAPGVIYGVSLAALGTPVPEPFSEAQNEFLTRSGSGVESLSNDLPTAVEASRGLVEPLAPYNRYGNSFLDATSSGLDDAATKFGPFIQPGDRSLREIAGAMRDAAVSAGSCGAGPEEQGT